MKCEFCMDYAEAFLKNNFFYTYLKGRLEKGQEACFRHGVLIVGSSHALGIREDVWDDAVNCSMHSQDIYYDLKCIMEVLDDMNPNGRYDVCYMVMGYYMPFQDLSLSKKSRDALISRTYYPIFHDAHNWKDPDIYDHWKDIPGLSEEEKTIYEQEAVNRSKTYRFYSDDTVQRKPLYDLKGNTWAELSEEARADLCQYRTNSHNSLEQHKESYVENLQLMKQTVDYLRDKGVALCVVITPFSKEYNSGISSSMKNAFFEMLDKSRVPEVIDFNDTKYYGNFDVTDFMDFDHLNEKGCEKFSKLLRSIGEII